MRRGAWWCAAGLAALCMAIGQDARAQGAPPPADVVAVLDQIADIDKMRVITPLRLNADQVGRIIDAIRAGEQQYSRALNAVGVPTVRGIAEEVRATRQRALAGEAVPAAFTERVRSLSESFARTQQQEYLAAVRRLAEAIKGILTEEQYASAVRLAREVAREERSTRATGTDDQFFNLYVVGTFVSYPRITPLLEDLRSALSGRPAGNAAERP